MSNSETETPETAPVLVPRPNGQGAILTGGVPGHKGGTGRRPDALRAVCRDTFGLIIEELAPACLSLCRHIAVLADDDADPEAVEAAQEAVARFRKAGWTPEQLARFTNAMREAGLPRQSEVRLETPDVLLIVADRIGTVYGPGRVAECIEGIVQALEA